MTRPSARAMVPIVAVMVWAGDAALIVGSGFSDPGLGHYTVADLARQETSLAVVTAMSIVLAYSSLPLINAWACVSQLGYVFGTDLALSQYYHSPATYIGYYVAELSVPAAAAFLLRYPRRRLAPAHRLWVIGLVVVLPLLSLLELTSLSPVRLGEEPGGWWTFDWPSVVHDHYIFPALAAADLTATVVTTGLLVRSWLRAQGSARPGALARVLAMAVVVVVGTEVAFVPFWWTGDFTRFGFGASHWIIVAQEFAPLMPAVVAISPLVDLLRRRTAHARVAEVVVNVAQDGLSPALNQAVARTLGDPRARVLPTAIDEARPGTLWAPVNARDGSGLATLEVDPAAGYAGDGPLIVALTSALSLGLDNARLRFARQAAMTDLAQTRATIVEAALEERRRVERDLHDGAQQALLGVSAVLSRAVLVADGSPLDALVDDARGRLRGAVDDLDRLANGLRPAELAVGGLARALPLLASSSSLKISLDLAQTTTLLPDVIEATAYFVVAEAISNAVKHAQATRVDVSIARIDTTLEVTIDDDGVGGAYLRPGGGLAGLADRVQAAGGRFSVIPGIAGGTRTVACLPCPA
jgi:signal transduction histidine kinase